VDILFATIGVFVIVFALQDPEPPTDLQPAPYAHLLICHDSDRLGYVGPDYRTEVPLSRGDLDDGRVAGLLAAGGRVLVALGPDCVDDVNRKPMAEALRTLEETLGNRVVTTIAPLTLFEYAPLGTGPNDAEALVRRFLESLSR